MLAAIPISTERKGIHDGYGWAPDGAVQDQIERSLKDVVSAALARLPV